MNKTSKSKLIFEGQVLHFAALAILLGAIYALRDTPGFRTGSFLGLSTSCWVVLVIADAVIHQVYVWFCWRVQLHDQALTRWFGEKAFDLYAALFTVLFVLRPMLVFSLGWSNRGTLDLNAWIGFCVSVILVLPVIYMMYSIVHFPACLRDRSLRPLLSLSAFGASGYFRLDVQRHVCIRLFLALDPHVSVSVSDSHDPGRVQPCLYLGSLFRHGKTGHGADLWQQR
jgi:hypothetical protein